MRSFLRLSRRETIIGFFGSSISIICKIGCYVMQNFASNLYRLYLERKFTSA